MNLSLVPSRFLIAAQQVQGRWANANRNLPPPPPGGDRLRMQKIVPSFRAAEELRFALCKIAKSLTTELGAYYLPFRHVTRLKSVVKSRI